MKYLRITAFIIVFLVCLTLIALGISHSIPKNEYQETPSIILRYAEVNPPDHIITKTGQYFADCVKELSRGRIEIMIYDSGKLGDDSQYYQQMQIGALDMYRGNAIALADISDMNVGVLSMPYIFRDNEHFWDVCGSDLGKEILDNIQVSGSNMVGLCYLDEGARSIMLIDKPTLSEDLIKDKVIRTMVSMVPEETIRLMGGNPVAMNYSDLFTALQQRIVDGAENPVSSYYYNQFYKVAPFYIRTEHMRSPSIMLISEITWNHLSEEDKDILREASQMAQVYNKSELEATEIEIYNLLEEKGVAVLDLPDNDKLKKAVEPAYHLKNGKYDKLVEAISKK